MKVLLHLSALLFCLQAVGQRDDPSIDLMVTEDGWRKEAFHFPKPFAPEVDFDGVADVRFTEGWGDIESPHFWSYAFAWKIDLDQRLSDSELEHYLELYFDGLMQVVNRDETLEIPSTNALFISAPLSEGGLGYEGKIKLYDAFFSYEMVTLLVNGEYRYCSDLGVHLYLFRLSPQPEEHPTWDHLSKTVLREELCRG